VYFDLKKTKNTDIRQRGSKDLQVALKT